MFLLRSIFSYLLLLSAFLSQMSYASDWQTWFEKHNYRQTPRFGETLEFSKRLSDASPKLDLQTFGYSHQGRELFALIWDADGLFAPDQAKAAGKTIVLVQAAIHPGEPAGKDAGLQLLRDIAIHEQYADDFTNVTLIFIPILNPDGHERFGPYNRINQNGPEEMGWRTNARNLNLNRDYLKADAKEMQHLLGFWHQWEPDFFMDTHSTNGGDYQYTMTWAMDLYGGSNPDLVNWINNNYIPVIESLMEEEGYPLFPYVTYRSWHDPRSGVRSGAGNPMFSNVYASELNRPGLLLETHMLKPYPERVESTYRIILNTIRILNRQSSLHNVIAKADQFTASPAFRKEPFPLRFRNTSDSVMVDFLGVQYEKKVSSLTGGNWFIYDPDSPETYTVAWFNQNEVTYSVQLPDAYIVPVEYSDIIERLSLHGIEMHILDQDLDLKSESYRFSDVELSSRSREGRQTASFQTETIEESRLWHKGSVIIPMDQPKARIIAHALEPMAPGSFAYWGFFNAVFERIEYAESYVMEAMAREMIDKDPQLLEKLEEVKKENPSLEGNSFAILNWFYEQTPYFDERYNVYPVGRISTTNLPAKW